MDEVKQGGMLHSKSVDKQLNQLEQQNVTNEKNEKGTTNEIQPMATDDKITQ